MKRKIAPYLPSALILGVIATASAQATSHDALALARNKAKTCYQHVLLQLRGGDPTADAKLGAALKHAAVRKMLHDEYQVVALPNPSLAAVALRKKLALETPGTPILVVLDTDDRVLATNTTGRDLHDFLKQNACAPKNAREELARGLAIAKDSKRHAFIYLSAPW